MGKRVNEELQGEWSARLLRQAGSGLTVREFCEREGVSVANFYAWRRKLGQSSRAKPGRANGTAAGVRHGKRQVVSVAAGDSPRGPRKSRKAPHGDSRAAVDAAAEIRFVQLPLPSNPGGTWIELTLHDGTVVRVPARNLPALELVLDSLLGRRANLADGEVYHA